MYTRNLVCGLTFSVLIILNGCKTTSYSLNADRNRELTAPPGMVYVPAGTVMLGDSTVDSALIKRVSLSAFYIDRTEITNKQYRQFVNWVRDSIAVTDYLKDGKYFKRHTSKDSTEKRIDWTKLRDDRILWRSNNRTIARKLQPMMYQGEIDPQLLNYRYETIKLIPGNSKRLEKHISEDEINVWPDETAWINDFPNSQNEYMTKSYFTDPLFDNYPVVGVSWKQARAFAAWRSRVWKDYIYRMKNPNMLQLALDLPTEAQWMYAASGVKKERTTKNSKGEKKAGTFTSPVNIGVANAFGIYNMESNVAEWTLNAYNENWIAFVHNLNPVMSYDAVDSDPDVMKKKVVRGGSWKDPEAFLSPETRNGVVQDRAKSYIGFRCVMPAPDFYSSKK